MRKFIGYVSVDSGQIMVGDPCYLHGWKHDSPTNENFEKAKDMKCDGPFLYTYAGACMASNCKDGAGVLGSFGASVAASTKYGDGSYPVYLVTDEYTGRYALVVEMGEME